MRGRSAKCGGAGLHSAGIHYLRASLGPGASDSTVTCAASTPPGGRSCVPRNPMQDVSGQRGARPPGSQVSCITEGGCSPNGAALRASPEPQTATHNHKQRHSGRSGTLGAAHLRLGTGTSHWIGSRKRLKPTSTSQRYRFCWTAFDGRKAQLNFVSPGKEGEMEKRKKGKRKKETATQQHSNTASVDTRQALGSSTAYPFGYIDPPRARDFAQFQKRAAEMLDGDWPVRIHNAYCQHSISPYPHPSPFAVIGGRSLSSSRQGVCQRGRSPKQSPEAPIDGHHR